MARVARATLAIAAHAMGLLVVLACVVAGRPLLAGQVAVVTSMAAPVLDGSLDDWLAAPLTVLFPGAEGTVVGNEREVAAGDVRIEVRSGWDARHLFVALTWSDDVFDVRPIARADSTWTDDSGNRRDRMYFHDNAQLRIETPVGTLAAWIAPNPERPFQWARATRGEEAPTFPDLAAAARKTGGAVTIEVAIEWTQLGVRPGAAFELGMQLVVPDADAPDAPLGSKADDLYWLEWRQSLRLAGDV